MHDVDFFEEEQIALERYANGMYSRRVPRPVKPSTSFVSLVGAEAFLYFVAGVSAALFSSIRTGGLFFIVENSLLEKYNLVPLIRDGISSAAFITALLTFEGIMIADGFSKGKNADEIKPSLVGMITASVVIGLGGLFSSTGLIQEFIEGWEVWLNLGIALVTAIASVIIVYVGGKNVGYTFLRAESKRAKINKEYTEEKAQWYKSALQSFKSSAQGKAFYQSLKDGNPSPAEEQGDTINLKPVEKPNTKTGRIKQILNEIYTEERKVPSFTKLAKVVSSRALNVALEKNEMSDAQKEQFLEQFNASHKGMISTARNEWVKENNLN